MDSTPSILIPRLPKPYYETADMTLYHGRAEEVVPALAAGGLTVDAIVTDPPYNETSCDWDHWPSGWPGWLLGISRQMWCFGSLRMFLEKNAEFAGWSFAQDVVWEKHNGSNARKGDRFRRVHEQAAHWYQGDWESLYTRLPTVKVLEDHSRKPLKRTQRPQHWNAVERGSGYSFDGTRQQRSVIFAKSCHGMAVNETQKPEAIVAPLVAFSVPKGGIVLDLFAGSGTTLAVARSQKKRAIGIEMREDQCEHIVARLAQEHMVLDDEPTAVRPPDAEQEFPLV